MLYLCSLPNPGKPGAPHEFLTHDWRQAEDWARREDRPGRGVYYCVNPLREGARTRSKETVAAITGLHVDIDFKDIDEDSDEVDRRLQACHARRARSATAAAAAMPGGSSRARSKPTIPITRRRRRC